MRSARIQSKVNAYFLVAFTQYRIEKAIIKKCQKCNTIVTGLELHVNNEMH